MTPRYMWFNIYRWLGNFDELCYSKRNVWVSIGVHFLINILALILTFAGIRSARRIDLQSHAINRNRLDVQFKHVELTANHRNVS